MATKSNMLVPVKNNIFCNKNFTANKHKLFRQAEEMDQEKYILTFIIPKGISMLKANEYCSNMAKIWQEQFACKKERPEFQVKLEVDSKNQPHSDSQLISILAAQQALLVTRTKIMHTKMRLLEDKIDNISEQLSLMEIHKRNSNKFGSSRPNQKYLARNHNQAQKVQTALNNAAQLNKQVGKAENNSICNYCKKSGHFMKNCWFLLKKLQNRKQEKDSIGENKP